MVTAWPRSGLLRARSSAGLLRLLWLAALVLTVLLAHGVSTETTEGHVTAGVAASAHVSAGIHEGHSNGEADSDDVPYVPFEATVPGGSHDDASSHPGQACVAGQPQQGPDMAAPGLAPLEWATPLTHAYTVGKFRSCRPDLAVPPLTGARVPVVQQV